MKTVLYSTACEARTTLPSFRMTLTGVPALPLAGRHGVVLAVFLVMSIGVAQAQAGPPTPLIIAAMLKWTPLLAQGFALNIAMSFLAMAIGTVFGLALGLGQISLLGPIRASARLITQFFRNSPWLVLLFYCMLLLPFEVRIGNSIVALPGWAKSTFGLALPVMANVSDWCAARCNRSLPASGKRPRRSRSPGCKRCA